MTSDGSDTTAAATFELTCIDCEYSATVEGSLYEAFDVADTHQEEHGETDSDHFVNVERVESPSRSTN